MSAIRKLCIPVVTAIAALVATSSAALAIGSPASPGRALASSSRMAHNAVMLEADAPGAQAAVHCSSGNFCDYILPNYGGTCYSTPESQTSLAGCRNRDESIANGSADVVRMFYSPNFAGAWVCINPGTQFANLSGYRFNNGPHRAGYGSPVEDDVASIQFGTGRCGNPL